MKLLFNTQTLEGHWFYDNETTAGYTGKIPPGSNFMWDAGSGGWIETPEASDDAAED